MSQENTQPEVGKIMPDFTLRYPEQSATPSAKKFALVWVTANNEVGEPESGNVPSSWIEALETQAGLLEEQVEQALIAMIRSYKVVSSIPLLDLQPANIPIPVEGFASTIKRDIEKAKMHHAEVEQVIRFGINEFVALCYNRSKESGWWTNLQTGQPLDRNKGEMLMLMVSEIAEAMEGCRKNLNDDKLPHRPMVEVELADCMIRIADFCGGWGLDLSGAIIEKMEYNAHREDHKIENRKAENGKLF